MLFIIISTLYRSAISSKLTEIYLLQALATTIKRDPTAPHYKYHDDPYLIPVSSANKRTYALSQESGRKAAMWIREKHANLFQHRDAEPPIEVLVNVFLS